MDDSFALKFFQHSSYPSTTKSFRFAITPQFHLHFLLYLSSYFSLRSAHIRSTSSF